MVAPWSGLRIGQMCPEVLVCHHRDHLSLLSRAGFSSSSPRGSEDPFKIKWTVSCWARCDLLKEPIPFMPIPHVIICWDWHPWSFLHELPLKADTPFTWWLFRVFEREECSSLLQVRCFLSSVTWGRLFQPLAVLTSLLHLATFQVFFFFCLFGATPGAYGSSQARG